MSRLGVRLPAAFVAVAIGAVALLAALTLVSASRQVSTLSQEQRTEDANAVASTLADAYRSAGGWRGADLRTAEALATSMGARLQVFDSSGAGVSSVSPSVQASASQGSGMGHDSFTGRGFGQGSGPYGPGSGGRSVSRSSVVVDGQTVGTAVLRFPSSGLSAAEQHVRDALQRTILAGAGLAALLALVVAIPLSRRISRPIVRLTRKAEALEAGDLAARSRLPRAPGEISELAGAFDRMAETLSREDALRRTLVADVAHELRTPLTILRADLEEMVNGTVPPSADRLGSLHDETLRLGHIVEDLESLAAAQAAALRLERRHVDLASVAAETVERLRGRFAASEVKLATSLQPVEVDGDASRLGQVVTNLLTNAQKFTPTGGSVTLSVAPEGPTARLEVADTGPGIPPEELPHIFERFWRGSAGRGSRGSGIGLAIVAELVRAHRGRVEVDSEAGCGARFTVFLPRV